MGVVIGSYMSIWNDAIERCIEGRCGTDELAALLMRIDLPEESRQAINETVAMVNGLDQSLQTPQPPAGAIGRLSEKMRSQPLLAGLESLAAMLAAPADSAKDASDLPESEDESEAEEFRQLAAALDSFHRSMPIPKAGHDRLLERLGQHNDTRNSEELDVRAAFDLGSESATDIDEAPTVIPLPADFFDPNAPRDVLAASKETPLPNTSSNSSAAGDSARADEDAAPKLAVPPDPAGKSPA